MGGGHFRIFLWPHFEPPPQQWFIELLLHEAVSTVGPGDTVECKTDSALMELAFRVWLPAQVSPLRSSVLPSALMWAFSCSLIQRSCNANFYVFFRGSCTICSCLFTVFVGGGEFRNLLHGHLNWSPSHAFVCTVPHFELPLDPWAEHHSQCFPKNYKGQ